MSDERDMDIDGFREAGLVTIILAVVAALIISAFIYWVWA